MSGMALLTVFVVPFIWSAIVSGLRRIMRQRPEAPDDGFEKQQLLILLTPVVLGLGLLILSRFLPVHIPQMALPLQFIAHDVSPAASPVTGTVAKQSLDIGLWSVITVWTVYVAGVAVKAVPLVLAFARLRRIVALAKVSEIAGEGVRITEAPVPPLAWGALDDYFAAEPGGPVRRGGPAYGYPA
jgi:predicted neutral ceramidase superfamily lipid hydrolase